MNGITEFIVANIYDYMQRHKERAFALKFSAMEICIEVVRDLISSNSTPLRLLDDPELNVQVPCVVIVENLCHFDADGKLYYPFGRGSGSQDFWGHLLLSTSCRLLLLLGALFTVAAFSGTGQICFQSRCCSSCFCCSYYGGDRAPPSFLPSSAAAVPVSVPPDLLFSVAGASLSGAI